MCGCACFCLPILWLTAVLLSRWETFTHTHTHCWADLAKGSMINRSLKKSSLKHTCHSWIHVYKVSESYILCKENQFNDIGLTWCNNQVQSYNIFLIFWKRECDLSIFLNYFITNIMNYSVINIMFLRRCSTWHLYLNLPCLLNKSHILWGVFFIISFTVFALLFISVFMLHCMRFMSWLK